MVLTASATTAQSLVLSGPLVLAVLLSAAAGALSFFSPCCLPLVPGYLSYVAGVAGSESEYVPSSAAGGTAAGTTGGTVLTTRPQRQVPPRSRVLLGAALFIAGFATVFSSYGAIFGSLGAALIVHQQLLMRVLGAATILFGLMFTGLLWRVPLAGRTFRLAYRPNVGLGGAPLLGALFGIGWTPCIGPTLAAVLTLATSSAGAARGALLSFAYSMGLGVPFLLAALSLHTTLTRFQWARRHPRGIMRTGGATLMLLGALEVSGLWSQVMSHLQSVIANWQTPL